VRRYTTGTSVDALGEGEPFPVEVGGRELVLVKWRASVYALKNVCPHMSKSFDGGAVLPRVGGTPRSIEFIEDDPVITCPWHQFEFSLESAVCLADPTLRVARYKVTVDDDGSVLVDLPALPSDKRPESPLRLKTSRDRTAAASG
jgi:3-phenylpropionate/trans-cinnamate dioxygenase ferredoxin subunit